MASRNVSFLLLATAIAGSIACSARGGGGTGPIVTEDTPSTDDAPPTGNDAPPAGNDAPPTGNDTPVAPPDREPSCGAPRMQCGDLCVDVRSDALNCGGCNNRCGAGQSCSNGACVGGTTCAAPRQMCGATCSDLSSDASNCGVCGLRCGAGQVCAGGNCTGGSTTCTPPQRLCSGRCVDVSFDLDHCGACGNACPSGQACVSGRCGGGTTCAAPRQMCGATCADVTTDPVNCGFCGNRCPTGQTCSAGRCAGSPPASGAAGGPCTRNSDCPGGACLSAGEGWTGGYCIYGCPSTATEGDPCGSGGTGICLDVGGTALICFRQCVPSSSACRSGYVCESITTDNSEGICTPDCRSNPALACGAYRCQPTGTCGPVPCTSTSCSLGSVCNPSTQRCECGSSTACGASRRCFPRTGTTAPACGCTSSAACAADETCDTATGRCM